MSDISNLLESLYNNDSGVQSIEKTAEDILLAELRGEGQVSENPYENMSSDDLLDILNGDGAEKVASVTGDTPDLLEKTAAEMLGGQVMAHAMVHEMTLIKEAMTSGFCRVCKSEAMDIQGSSICSGCQGQSE
tara:strand:+ start:64 stop:462 length:399 start_codon:yes stop_codon:yes gene_type:complete